MLKKIWRFIWVSALIFFATSILAVIIFRWVPIPGTILMVERYYANKWNHKPAKIDKKWVPLSQISNNLQLAVVSSEDQNFLWHHGFDFDAIQEAMKYNEQEEKKPNPHLRGASTISQQTAKNAFLFPARNFIRKGLEAYFTFLIELFWSKERIMEVYLNVIEMGDGIYGAEAASQYYFHHSAAKLTKPEAALIAAILPSPLRMNPARPSAYLLDRQSFILGQMALFGGKLDYAMKKPVYKKG